MAEFRDIPLIDIGGIDQASDDELQRLASLFRQAYGDVGFGYITNHGVPQSLIDRVFAASQRFHALPHAAKMKVELIALHRGFIPINTSTDVNSTLADVTRPNQSESFMMMREDGPDAADVRNSAYLAGPNQWPELDQFREDVTAYHDAMTALGRQLMRLALISIGASPDHLNDAFERPTTWLRLLFYPSTDPQGPMDLYGSAPHTDFGCLTILAQDDVGGLQVQTPAGNWIDAPRIPGTFVVNVGDMLHRWSNGRLRSTPHRVINKSGKERYSCPFFFDPNVAADIAPLTSCIKPGEAPRFAPINFGDFLRRELEAGYEKHKAN